MAMMRSETPRTSGQSEPARICESKSRDLYSASFQGVVETSTLYHEFRVIETTALSDCAAALIQANEFLLLHSVQALQAKAPPGSIPCEIQKLAMVCLRIPRPPRSAPIRLTTAPWFSREPVEKVLLFVLHSAGANVIFLPRGKNECFLVAPVSRESPGGCHLYRIEFEIPARRLFQCQSNGLLDVFQELVAKRRLLIMAAMLGTLKKLCRYVLDYSQKRVTFGKAICHHQAVALQIADGAMNLEIANSLCRNACLVSYSREELFAITKGVWEYVSRLVLETGLAQIQLMGGHGYLQSHPAQEWLCELHFLLRFGVAQEASGGFDADA